MLTDNYVHVLGVAWLMEFTKFKCKVRSTPFAKEITAQCDSNILMTDQQSTTEVENELCASNPLLSSNSFLCHKHHACSCLNMSYIFCLNWERFPYPQLLVWHKSHMHVHVGKSPTARNMQNVCKFRKDCSTERIKISATVRISRKQLFSVSLQLSWKTICPVWAKGLKTKQVTLTYSIFSQRAEQLNKQVRRRKSHFHTKCQCYINLLDIFPACWAAKQTGPSP